MKYRISTLLLLVTIACIFFSAVGYEFGTSAKFSSYASLDLHVENRNRDVVSNVSFALVNSELVCGIITENAAQAKTTFVNMNSDRLAVLIPTAYRVSPILKRRVAVNLGNESIDTVLFRIEYLNEETVYEAITDWHPHARDQYAVLDLTVNRD